LPHSTPPVEVVYHGADLARICGGFEARSNARRLLGLGVDDLVVGTVGNFTAKKDHRTLLTAIASLVTRRPDVRLVLVGIGPLESELRAQVRDAGLEGMVLFTGLRDDVYALLPGFDVFALSSRHEGLPIALLEAMATGVPCVATSVGGIPEVVTDGIEGVLVEPGHAGELAAALEKVLTDATFARTLATAAQLRARDFDLGRAVVRTEAIYDRCLEDG
jgi:glycosyltransferase involved in cell wall biosynthesis